MTNFVIIHEIELESEIRGLDWDTDSEKIIIASETSRGLKLDRLAAFSWQFEESREIEIQAELRSISLSIIDS